jgi:hypothetical protein
MATDQAKPPATAQDENPEAVDNKLSSLKDFFNNELLSDMILVNTSTQSTKG